MTWVFGTATNFIGTAVCVADIQVTVGDTTFDCLRKLYVIDQNVLAGFAGNVEVGFTMLAHLQRLIDDERGNSGSPVEVQRVLTRYSAVAKSLYTELDPTRQQGGCAVLIAGASPADEAVYGSRPQVARFVAPEFRRDEIPRGTWGSIGSGAEVAQYRKELEATTGRAADGLLQMEAGWLGGYANVMSTAILQSVFEMPSERGISKHFHVCIVTANGCQCRTSDRTVYPPQGLPRRVEMPEVATSWPDLQTLLAQRLGVAPASVAA